MEPYLAKEWTDSQTLRERAKIPTDMTFQTKPDIALSIIKRALQNGVPRAVVLGDGAYGNDGNFRDGVRDLGLDYAVGIQLDTKVQLIRNEEECVSVKDLLARVGARPFRRYTWREGSKKALHARFAFFPVRIPKSKHKEALWLMIERRDVFCPHRNLTGPVQCLRRGLESEMSRRNRRYHAPSQKAALLRKHHLDKVLISDLCAGSVLSLVLPPLLPMRSNHDKLPILLCEVTS